MSDETLTMPDAQEILDALPYLVMVLDEHHRVVMSNSWFAANCGEVSDECPVACYERVHGSTEPHPDCPLAECARTGKLVMREIADAKNGRVLVTVVPFKMRFGKERLFLHLTEIR